MKGICKKRGDSLRVLDQFGLTLNLCRSSRHISLFEILQGGGLWVPITYIVVV